MQLNPNQNIFLSYLISDPADPTVYYVKSVMRNIATNATLGSVKLTRAAGNGRRFYGSIQAPNYNGTVGLQIDVTTTVYTDAAYTQQSNTYQEQLERYLIAPLWSPAVGGGGSGDPFAAGDMRTGLVSQMRALFEEFTAKDMPVGSDAAAELGAVKDEIMTSVRKAMRRADSGSTTLDATEALSDLENNVVAALDPLKHLLEGMRTDLRKVLKHVEFMWEHDYLQKMSAPLMPPEGAKSPRTPSELVKPVQEVMRSHMARKAGIEGVLPKEGAAGPVGPVDLTPSKRAPSQGVVPVHVVARNKAALEQLPA